MGTKMILSNNKIGFIPAHDAEKQKIGIASATGRFTGTINASDAKIHQ